MANKDPVLEKTIPDLPENRKNGQNQHASRPSAKWKSIMPPQPSPLTIASLHNTAKSEKPEEKKSEAQKLAERTNLADRLSNATIQNNLELVKKLVDEDGVHPNEKDSCGRTPLVYARFMGRKEILEFFKSRMKPI